MCSFPASLGLQNRLVNKEIELWVSILSDFVHFELLMGRDSSLLVH